MMYYEMYLLKLNLINSVNVLLVGLIRFAH